MSIETNQSIVNENVQEIIGEKSAFLYDSENGTSLKVSIDAYKVFAAIKEENSVEKVLNRCNAKGIRNLIDIFYRKGLLKDLEKKTEMVPVKVSDSEILAGKMIKNLRLNITENCNLNCTYCYEKVSNTYKKRRIMSFEIAKTAIDTFVSILTKNDTNTATIRFFGGEPLLNSNLVIQAVEYCNRILPAKIHMTYLINTNGTLLNETMCKEFAKHKVHIILSVDGTKEVHDINRVYLDGTGTFDVLSEKIDLLYKENCEFNYSVVCTDNNYPHLKEFIDYVNDKHIRNGGMGQVDVSFNTLHICDRKGIVDSPSDLQISYLMDAIKYARSKKTNTYGGLTYTSFVNFMRNTPGRHCAGIGSELSVAPNGDIYPCTGIDIKLGTILEFDDTFFDGSYKMIAKRDLDHIPECQGCSIKAFCAGGCYADYLSQAGKEKETLRDCDLNRKMFKELIKIYLEL